ncbi:20665_t:CDS:2 [Entrophospora sp. SA101]|nr:20665_t:CDS:2 [Entrophospora sp. SA101]
MSVLTDVQINPKVDDSNKYNDNIAGSSTNNNDNDNATGASNKDNGIVTVPSIKNNEDSSIDNK